MNTSFARVKRPISFRLIWPPIASEDISSYHINNYDSSPGDHSLGHEDCFYSIWFPEAPKGYVALGCVVSNGIMQPPLSSVFCVATSLVSVCSLRDCISISTSVPYVKYQTNESLLCSFFVAHKCCGYSIFIHIWTLMVVLDKSNICKEQFSYLRYFVLNYRLTQKLKLMAEVKFNFISSNTLQSHMHLKKFSELLISLILIKCRYLCLLNFLIQFCL